MCDNDSENSIEKCGIGRLDEVGPYEDDELKEMNFECPVCQLAIAEWTKCPGCHWYDGDVWEATMQHYSKCRECNQTIGGGSLCDGCDTVEGWT